MKKIALFFLTLLLFAFGAAGVTAAEYRFTDVPVKSWYHHAVYTCAEQNIMKGVSENLFAPEATMTRGMFVTIIARNSGVDECLYTVSPFGDVDIHEWYGPSVAWAVENEVVFGYEDQTFRPGQFISREELMQMLYQYAAYCKMDTTAEQSALERFSDGDKVSPWAKDAAAWNVEHQYFSGMTSTDLFPRGLSTRAQVSKVMAVWMTGSYSYRYQPVAGLRTVKNLINTALEPVGSTLYIYGGGWNAEDTGAGIEGRTIGVSPTWKQFFDSQDASYDFEKYRNADKSPIPANLRYGLDCSGYVGWVIYNVTNAESGGPGYVMPSTEMASAFSSYGWGTYTPAAQIQNYKPGDIMSTKGHVYISLGLCSDGSEVLLHSSPPGVMITGTYTPAGKENSEAYALAKKYQAKYFPAWYSRNPKLVRDADYLTQYNQMRWTVDNSAAALLRDPDGYQSMTPEEILIDLLGY